MDNKGTVFDKKKEEEVKLCKTNNNNNSDKLREYEDKKRYHKELLGILGKKFSHYHYRHPNDIIIYNGATRWAIPLYAYYYKNSHEQHSTNADFSVFVVLNMEFSHCFAGNYVYLHQIPCTMCCTRIL